MTPSRRLKPFALFFSCLVLFACSSSTTVTPGAPVDGGSDISTGDTTYEDGLAADTGPGVGDAIYDITPYEVPAGDTFDSGGGGCDAGACPAGLTCCLGGIRGCVNLKNDPFMCGDCLLRCHDATTMCLGGTCVAPTCAPACKDGQSCCDIPGPGPSGPPKCVDGPTCPVGCPLCK